MDGDGLSDGDSGESMVGNFASKSTECEGVLNARYGLSACHAVHTSSTRFHPHGRAGLSIAYTNHLVPSFPVPMHFPSNFPPPLPLYSKIVDPLSYFFNGQ